MPPSAMQEDLPSADADQLFSLEQSVEWMESKNEATHKVLQELLDKMNAALPMVIQKQPTNT
jgi:hypothetical protein